MKRTYLLIAISISVAIALSQPQWSEHFTLTKSVIDAGGTTATSEHFQQVSAFGQSSPLGVQSSENFALSPGFLSPRFLVSPLSPIQELVIKENQPHVNLWWEAVSGAGTYSVYRDTVATFTPDGINLLGTTTSTAYTDSNITATPAERYFYIITSSP